MIETFRHEIFDVGQGTHGEHRGAEQADVTNDLNKKLVISTLRSLGITLEDEEQPSKARRSESRQQSTQIEKMEQAKEENHAIYVSICTRISQLISLSKPPQPLELLTPLYIHLEGVNAMFVRLEVIGQTSPLVIRLHDSNKGSLDEVDVHWSYHIHHPSDVAG